MVYFKRSVVSVLAMLCWIEAVKHFGANPSILVLYGTPLISVLLASALAAEKLNKQCFIVSMLCYIILCTGLKTEIKTSLYGFTMACLASILWACYEIICKKQTKTEHYLAQVFYAFLQH